MSFKLVISDPKSGASVQKDANDEASKGFMGLKIGDNVKGEVIDLTGYEFLLTGGSDYCGFPMRRDVPGVGRKKILAYQGIGIRKLKKGILQRKTVCGNTIHAKITQINLKVVKQGTENIFTAKKEVKKDDAKEGKEVKPEKQEKTEVKKEPAPAAPEKKEAPAEKKAEKPAEPKKEAPAPDSPK